MLNGDAGIARDARLYVSNLLRLPSHVPGARACAHTAPHCPSGRWFAIVQPNKRLAWAGEKPSSNKAVGRTCWAQTSPCRCPPLCSSPGAALPAQTVYMTSASLFRATRVYFPSLERKHSSSTAVAAVMHAPSVPKGHTPPPTRGCDTCGAQRVRSCEPHA